MTRESLGDDPSRFSFLEFSRFPTVSVESPPKSYLDLSPKPPDHFAQVLEDADWAHRIRGIRCNASRKSHSELDESETLDDGNPVELGGQYKGMREKMPWLNVFGGCCGSDLRHVTQIAKALTG